MTTASAAFTPSHRTPDSIQWLLAVWGQIARDQGDVAPLYRWLAAHPWHPDRLLRALPLAADRWLATSGLDRATAARVVATFGTAMQQYPEGDRAAQIELAIAAYQLALTVLPAADRAIALTDLATAYRQRPTGDRAANLDQAIRLYQAVVALPAASPWPVAMAGLAAAYGDRAALAADPAADLDCTIATYQRLLTQLDRQTLPVAWRAMAAQLAAAYGDRPAADAGSPEGDRIATVQRAIDTYRLALAP